MRHLLIIGAQRCGTTYLHSLLEAHPDIAMARPARPEPKVFLRPDVCERGVGWYHAEYFPHAGNASVLGEKSTSYIESADAAAAASRVLVRASILAQLRDPVERAISNWRFSTANGFEDRPLGQALRENLRTERAWDPSATSVSPYAYLERGRYADYLEPWYAAFGDDMHILFFEEVAGRPRAVTALYRTLGVDPAFEPEGVDQRVNESEGAPPEVDSDLLPRLREYFASSDEALRRLLRRDLPWDHAT